MAAGDLVSLQDVELWLNIKAANADESILPRLITAASRYIEAWLSRIIASTVFSESRNGPGGASMLFADYPVTAISSLSVGGVNIPASPDGIQAGYVFDVRAIYLIGYIFAPGFQNVKITYTAGYTTIPSDLAQACIELVALRYRERGRIGEVSKSIQGETISYSQKDIPASVSTILEQYKKRITVY